MDARETTLMEVLLTTLKEKIATPVVLTRLFDSVDVKKFSGVSGEFISAYQQQFGPDIINGNSLISLTEENVLKIMPIMQALRDSIMEDPQFKAVLNEVPNERRAEVYRDVGIALLNRITGQAMANLGKLEEQSQRDNLVSNMQLLNTIYRNHDKQLDLVFESVKQDLRRELAAKMFQHLGISKDTVDGKTILDLTSINEKSLANNLDSISKFKQDLVKNAQGKNTTPDPNFDRTRKVLASVPPEQKAQWVHKVELNVLQEVVTAAKTNTNAKTGVLKQEQLHQLADNIINLTIKRDKDLGKQLQERNAPPKALQSTSNIFSSLKTLIGKNENSDKKKLDVAVAMEKSDEKSAVKFQEDSPQKEDKKSVTFGRRNQVIPNAAHENKGRYATLSRSGLTQSQGNLKEILKEHGNADAEHKNEEKGDVTTPNFFRRP